VLKRLVSDPACSKYVWNISSRCFTHIFPHEKLVYLSPKSPNVLTRFNHDDVYVIGATGDGKSVLCWPKIKELGIRSARLNIDPYFYKSSKSNFTILDLFKILVDARDTEGNWPYALRHLHERNVAQIRHEYKYLEQYMNLGSVSGDNIMDPFSDPLEEEFSNPNEHCFNNQRALLKPKNFPNLERTYSTDELSGCL